MKTKHTPGPWDVAPNGAAEPTIWKGKRAVAFLADGHGDARRNANAHLIAAAPDLLACVAGFVESWGREVDTDADINGSDAVEWINSAMFEFRAALVKAAGR